MRNKSRHKLQLNSSHFRVNKKKANEKWKSRFDTTKAKTPALTPRSASTVIVFWIARCGSVRAHHSIKGRGFATSQHISRLGGCHNCALWAVKADWHFIFGGFIEKNTFCNIRILKQESLRGSCKDAQRKHQSSQVCLNWRQESQKESQSTNLAILAEVCPHTCAIPSSHQHMVEEEVCTRYAADELARNAIIVVAQVGDHIVKL